MTTLVILSTPENSFLVRSPGAYRPLEVSGAGSKTVSDVLSDVEADSLGGIRAEAAPAASAAGGKEIQQRQA